MKRDQEIERLKQQQRELMNNQNIDFLKMQMDERDYVKRNMHNKEREEEDFLVGKAINEFDQKQTLKQEHMTRLQREHLDKLQSQIDERKRLMMNDDKMNINEANLNNYIGVKIRF